MINYWLKNIYSNISKSHNKDLQELASGNI